MKSPLLSVLVLTAVACSSCGAGETVAGGDGPVVIDLAANYPVEEITLQSIADVEYIPLDISPEVLLRSSDRVFHLSDQYIMVSSRQTGEICVFDRAGRIVSHFNRTGRAPNEYFSLEDVVFDEKAGEFFVFDGYLLTSKILVYSFDGKHKRTLPVPPECTIEMWNFDAGSLLIYDKTGLIESTGYSTTPYRLISKTDGSVIETLPIELPQRYSELIGTEIEPPTKDGNLTITHSSYSMTVLFNNRLGGKDFTLADISSDSVYTFTRERVLTPAFVRTPSVHASEPRTVWSTRVVTEDFIVFSITPLFQEGKVDSRSLMYDHTTGSISEVTFFDENYQQWRGAGFPGETDRPVNTGIGTLDPLRLKEAHKKGELKGPLAELAAKIKRTTIPL